jgi:ParB family chromosome partitioning protein
MKKVLKNNIVEVDLALIDEPQTMSRMEIDPDYISELAKSISETGLLQPVLLRPVGERLEVVAGHCRFLAHKRLELSTIKSIVKKMTDQEAAIVRATENLSRAGLTPMEEAREYLGLIEKFDMALEQVADKFGKTAGTIKRRMDLLKMPAALQQAVHKGQVSMSAAEELWPISNETDLEYYLLFAIENGCTKEVARQWCKQWKDTQRHLANPSEEGGGPSSPYAPRPYYVACDLCNGPEEMEKMVRMSICPNCYEVIKQNM